MKRNTNYVAKYKYGLKRGLFDVRDEKISLDYLGVRQSKSDLSYGFPTIFDQGRTNSCIGNGTAEVERFIRIKNKQDIWIPSREFIYYNARIPDQDTDQDNGAEIRNAIKGLVTYGVAPETRWEFLPQNITVTPPAAVYKDALLHKLLKYRAIPIDVNYIGSVLSWGYPIVWGIQVYDSFENNSVANTGIIPMPSASDSLLGGHCTVICGHDDEAQQLTCVNSWSDQWGCTANSTSTLRGFFKLPYAYVNPNLVSDLWVVTSSW